MDTVARGEQVESELNSFIRKRDQERRKQEGERPEEALYLESTRRYADRQQRQRWWEWLRFHEGQLRRHTASLEALISQHRNEAERYAGLLGVEILDETTTNGHKKGKAA